MVKKITAILLILVLTFSLAACGENNVEEVQWPTGPITVVVGYGAGGGTDLVARQIAQGMSEYLDVPFNVLNVAGGSASIAGEQVYKAAADGNTILAGPINVAAPWRVNDYVDIGWEDFYSLIGANSYYALLVSKGSQFETLDDFVQHAKANPNTLKWGHSGFGSLNQTSGDMMLNMLDLKATGVPYSSGGEAATMVMAGETDFTWLPFTDAASYINSGDLVALAVTNSQDMNIETTSGEYLAPSIITDYPIFKDFENLLGWGLHIRRDVDDTVMAKLMEAFEYAVNTDKYKAFCESNNLSAASSMGEEADYNAAYLESFVTWGLFEMDMAAEGISPEDFGIPHVNDFKFPPHDRGQAAKSWPSI